MYPLLSEYIEAILSADDNLEELRGLKPVLDSAGRPMMSSGNYAVVFKMQDSSGRYYALKCFLREQEGRNDRYKCISKRLSEVYSPYFVNVNFYDHELFVDSANSEQSEFPVLVMDWVDGLTLNEYVRQNQDSDIKLQHLAYSFGEMASWLIKQDFAHGDLKPDNIIVQKDGSIVLVDYDGMYVPELKYKSAVESGSPNYRHPLRTVKDYNSRIDDFSLIVILLSLKMIANNPELWNSTSNPDGLLFCESDFKDLWGNDVLNDAYSSLDDESQRLLGLLLIAISNKSLDGVEGELLRLKNPTLVKIFKYSRSYSRDNQLIYSKDKKCLLSGRNVTDSLVTLMPGTHFLAFDAFQNNKSIKKIELPNGLLGIGRDAFSGCSSLEEITIPDTLLYYEDLWGLKGCYSIKSIRSNYFHSENHSVVIHGHLVRVLSADPLDEFSIPKNVLHVEDEAFSLCAPIRVLHYPKSLDVDPAQFAHSSIKEIDHEDASEDHHCLIKNNELICFVADEPIDYRVPENVTRIGDYAFGGAKHLRTIIVPSSVKQLGWGCFSECYSLLEVTLPNSLDRINFYGFESCSSLERICIPDSVKSIYQSAFANCNSLEEVELGTRLQTIGDYAFENCKKLKSIKFKSSSVSIDFSAFTRCTSLETVLVPRGKAEEFRNMDAFAGFPVKIVEYEVNQ
jgi:serine/threonine protein kinase